LSDGKLVAHWTFDSADRDKVLSAVGSGLHGRLLGEAHIALDPERGSVLSLDGEDDYMECESDPSLVITGSVTCSVWMKAKIAESGWMSLLNVGTWYLGATLNTNRTEFGGTFRKGQDTASIWTEGSTDVNDGKWHHLAGVHDGARVCLYIDGTLVDFESRGGNAVAPTGPVYIGGAPLTKHQWNGLIDDVRIYSYALSPEEVKMLYEGKEPLTEKTSE
jgi:hypothetical protein